MNVERLLELSTKLFALENQYTIQAKLVAVRADLANIASNPAEASFQSSLVEHLKELRLALRSVTKAFTPVEQQRVDELLSGPEFSMDLYQKVKESIDQNAISPSVARDRVQTLETTRQKTLDSLRAVDDAGEFFGWRGEESASAGAIIEFTVPRSLFQNQFAPLVQELDFLKKLIALLAEASDEEGDAELVSLSTSDPVIALLVVYGVATTFGKVVNWGLGVWKQVEEIRMLRAQAKKIGLHSEAEIREFTDDKIQATIDKAIDEEAKRLTESISDSGRANEIANGLVIFLKPLLARMERGLTVDIKLLPHKPEDEAEAAKASELGQLAAQLVFPAAAQDPILKLTAPEAAKVTKRARGRGKATPTPTPAPKTGTPKPAAN